MVIIAAPSQLVKFFQQFGGLDLRSSDLLRDNKAATGLKNMTYRQTGAMSKRKGYQYTMDSTGGFGMTTFKNVNTTTGVITEELLTIDNNLHKRASDSFTIAYAGSGTASYSLVTNAPHTATVDGVQVAVTTITVGAGHDIVASDSAVINVSGGGTSTQTVSSVTSTTIVVGTAVTVEDGANISATNSLTGNYKFDLLVGGSIPASFNSGVSLDLGTGLEGSPVTISTLVTAINATDDFSVTKTSTVPAAFIPTAVAQAIGSSLEISWETWSSITTASGITNPFSTFYAAKTSTDFENATFAQINDVLYIATGHDVLMKYDGSAVYAAGLPQATIVSATGTHDGSGFDYDYKATYEYTDAKGNIVEGIASAVTTDTQTALIGTSTVTITVDDVASGSGYMSDSSDMKVHLWRTANYNGGVAGLYYLVETKTNTEGSSLVFTDNNTDVVITAGTQYVEPIKAHGIAPKCRYIDTWRGQLILAGNLTAPTTIYYSDIDSPEYFPAAANAFNLDTKVSGIKSLDNILYAFQEEQVDGVSGDFSTDNFQVDRISKEIGCAAHHTIQEVKSRLFFLSDTGVYGISPNGIEDVGAPIEPKFQKGNPFTFKSAVAFNWVGEDKYLLFMPVNPVDPSYSNDSTNEIYAFDYFRKSWLEWNKFNFHGGITEIDGDVWFSRRISGTVSTAKVSQNNNKYDYSDHNEAIDFQYKSHWKTMGEPSVWKKFLRCKIHSYDTSVNDFENDAFTVTVKTENDYKITTLTNVKYDFSGGALGWGNGPWGDFPWGEQRLTQLKKKLASKKARSMRIIFENNTIYENVLISGYELQVAVPYRQEMKE